MTMQTPYYLVDERAILRNMKVIARVRERSGARSVLALKCFSTWAVFGLMQQYMDGTTSSSLYEARLGHARFGKETHAYCVGFTRDEVAAVARFSDKIIFNSAAQLRRFRRDCGAASVGVRVNPGVSYSHFDLADPARRFSRLGITDKRELEQQLPLIDGVMFHFNCENDDFKNFSATLDRIGKTYAGVLKKVRWVSLGGGLYFTKPGYPVDDFCAALRGFSRRHDVQVYLEPGEAAITRSAELVTTVVDVVRNKANIAIVDASTEAHMLDLLIYRLPAKASGVSSKGHPYTVAGRSCLAGDVFGTFRFPSPLKVGSIIRLADAAGYTMVKKNWFNGLQMPSIVVKRLDGTRETVRNFTYEDFESSLS